jgi:predicted ester cyclase
MDGRDPKSVVERFLVDPRATDLIAGGPLHQRERRFREAFPDASVQVEQILSEGDLVAVHLRGRGTHLGIFQGCPATGGTWAAAGTAIYRVDAGRIAEAWINWDWLTVMEQLGCIRRIETVSA